MILSKITDADLVVADDAVGAAALDARLGVNDRSRLMAWVVADARGATLVMGKADALTVGKRLERQASKVRGARECLVAEAKEDIRVAMAGENLTELDPRDVPVLEAGMEASLAALCAKQAAEVYVGFTELVNLLPAAAPPTLPAPAAPPPTTRATPGLIFTESTEFQRGFRAAREKYESEMHIMQDTHMREMESVGMARQVLQDGVRPSELLQIIGMLQGALLTARHQTQLLATCGWRLIALEQEGAAELEHTLDVARWELESPDGDAPLMSARNDAFESHSLAMRDFELPRPQPVRPNRVAIPPPPGFRAESYDWMLDMSREDIGTLHARLAHPDANFMCLRETLDRVELSFNY